MSISLKLTPQDEISADIPIDLGNTRQPQYGRYLDELEKRHGEWRISKRTYILDWSHSFPNSIGAMTPDEFALNILQIREPDHPLYRPL